MSQRTFVLCVLISAIIVWAHSAVWAADAPKTKKAVRAAAKAPPGPKPTLANVAYGAHPKQVLDFYQAKSDKPTPVLFFIHGGGWMGGSKNNIAGLTNYLAASISVVSVEYRFVSDAHKAGIKPPVEWPLRDAARALQFVRSKAAEWNLDKTRIGASGGSAGACSSLWLAFHDDMADPTSSDPVARESTRLSCAGVMGAQTSLDPKQMREWIPNTRYGAHAFGFFKTVNGKEVMDTEACLAARDSILPWIKEYSPAALVSAGDPPICMTFSRAPAAAGEIEKDPTHSAVFGVKLKEKLDAAGVECHLVYPGAPDVKYANAIEFLIAKLKQ